MATLIMQDIGTVFNIGIATISCCWAVGPTNFNSGVVGTATTSITSGSLPPGMTLRSPTMTVTPTDSQFIQGFTRIEGTPTTPGTYTFNVHSVDSAANVGNISQTIVIKAAQTDAQMLPRATFTQPYSFTFDAAYIASLFALGDAGTVGPWTFTVTTTFDPTTWLQLTNMTLVGGATSGVLSTASFQASAAFNYGQVLDGVSSLILEFTVSGFLGGMPHTLFNHGLTAFSFFSYLIDIGPPPPNGNVGSPYSHTFTATEPANTEFVPVFTWNPQPFGWPPGLIFDPATATVSGIPTTPGTYGGTVSGIFISNFDQVFLEGVGGIQPIAENLGFQIVISAAPPPAGNFEGTFVGFFTAGKFGGGTL